MGEKTLVPRMSAGIMSGVPWTRLEVEREEAGEGLDGERLGDAGNAFDEGVAAAEQGEQGLVDHLLLAGDDLADLGAAVVEEHLGGVGGLLVGLEWFHAALFSSG